MNAATYCTNWMIANTRTEHVLWTSRATSGLCALLTALSDRGGSVVVPNNVCLTVIAAIHGAGLKPEFLDIDPGSQSICPDLLDCLSSSEKRIVLYPHMYGITHQHFSRIQTICRQRNWFLIEDCAQSLGAGIAGLPCGRGSDAAVYSFGRGKIIDCDFGGAVTVRDRDLFEQTRSVYEKMPYRHKQHSNHERMYGQLFKRTYAMWQSRKNWDFSGFFRELLSDYGHIFIHRCDDLPYEQIQAGIRQLDRSFQQRLKTAQTFQDACLREGLSFIRHPEESTYWRFNLLLPAAHRDALMKMLHRHQCHASSWFPATDRFIAKREDESSYPVSDEIGDAILNLWVSGTEPDYTEKVIGLIGQYLSSVRDDGQHKCHQKIKTGVYHV